MKELTLKEEEVMQLFWKDGAMFVRELVEKYPEPRPHFNTLSTYVRSLEEKGFLFHESIGTSYRYFAIISEEEYRSGTLKKFVKRFFNNSFTGVVSSLLKDKELSVDEVRKLLDEVEKSDNNK